MLTAVDLERLIADTEQEMLGVIARAEDERTRELYRMVRYHMGLDSDAPRGKRMRPLIGLLAVLWPSLVHLAHRSGRVEDSQRNNLLALRWRVVGWLLVIELVLGQNLFGRIFAVTIGPIV